MIKAMRGRLFTSLSEGGGIVSIRDKVTDDKVIIELTLAAAEELAEELIRKCEAGRIRAERANPETCLHKVLTGTHDGLVVCVSCDSTIDRDFYDDNQYQYDIDQDVWVWTRSR